MKVLVACEFSGVVRDAFLDAGHDAYSCDLIPSESGHPQSRSRHHIGDIFEFLKYTDGWDIMITHWPCTLLCNSGVRWLYGGKGKTVFPERWSAMEKSARQFRLLLAYPSILRIAAENPIPHRHAVTFMGKYAQKIQPWQFGHPETKATCLWLKNLPPLKPTNIVEGRTPRVHHASPGPDRWKERSRTLAGIAKAMAEQWGGLA